MWQYFGHSPLEILSAWLRGSHSFTLKWPEFEGRTVVFTHFSRVGIALAYRLLHLSPGDEVLAPSYNCGSEIDPMLWCGANVTLYRVDSHTMIDLKDIQSRVTSKTRAIYITHYFGWPQDLVELANWCREQNLLLIEDCALSLFSGGSDGPVGRMGDAAIHCFWKTLPVPDGGALSLRKESLDRVEKMRSPDVGIIFRRLQPFIKNWLRSRGKKYLGPFYKVLREPYRARKDRTGGKLRTDEEVAFPEIPGKHYFDQRIRDWDISRLSKGMMIRIERDKIVQIRRRNYERLYETVCDLPGIQPLFANLPERVCPLVFPVLVSDPCKWERSLAKRNIYPYRWWKYYHPALCWEGFSEAIKLKNHLLAFVVDQHIDENTVEYIANGIKAASLENR